MNVVHLVVHTWGAWVGINETLVSALKKKKVLSLLASAAGGRRRSSLFDREAGWRIRDKFEHEEEEEEEEWKLPDTQRV